MFGSRSARALAAVACAVAIWAPTPPGAEARFGAGEAQDSLSIAWGYWRTLLPSSFVERHSTCRPGDVRIDWHLSLGSAMATATLDGCLLGDPVIDLERPTIRGLSDRHGCAVITHEYGHLLGFRHVSDPDALMSGVPTLGTRPPSRATWRRAWNRCERRL